MCTSCYDVANLRAVLSPATRGQEEMRTKVKFMMNNFEHLTHWLFNFAHLNMNICNSAVERCSIDRSADTAAAAAVGSDDEWKSAAGDGGSGG